jgi:hypothetical protein
MPTPKEYFDDPREADLADRVWTKSAQLPGHWELQWGNEIFINAKWPWLNKRIIWARDWITYQREYDGLGGTHSLNAQFGTDFNAIEIADVEHFYVAAVFGTIGGPAGGPMLNVIADGSWELIVGPTRIAWSHGLKAGLHSFGSNWDQLVGPDTAGARFGSFYPFNDLIEHLK